MSRIWRTFQERFSEDRTLASYMRMGNSKRLKAVAGSLRGGAARKTVDSVPPGIHGGDKVLLYYTPIVK